VGLDPASEELADNGSDSAKFSLAVVLHLRWIRMPPEFELVLMGKDHGEGAVHQQGKAWSAGTLARAGFHQSPGAGSVDFFHRSKALRHLRVT